MKHLIIIIFKLSAMLFWLFSLFLGFAGAMLILYSVVVMYKEQWSLLERMAPFISTLLTLLGTVMTAASVYFYSHNVRPPLEANLIITAPLVIIGGIVAICFLV